MGSTAEFGDMRRMLGELRGGIDQLRGRYGDVTAVRRIANDVDRLDIDLTELSAAAPQPRSGVRAATGETVLVPDTPYDPALWHDADDEGVGGHSRHR